MAKHQISDLLDELQSNEAYIRNDAIKKIIKGKINDEKIIIALKEVIENDRSMAVRNFARSAMNVFSVEHSAAEESVEFNTKNSKDNVSQTNQTIDNTVINWLLIGLLAGLIPGLIMFLLSIGDPAGVSYTICIGYAGIVFGTIGASLGKRNETTAWITAILISILGAGLMFMLVIFTCVFCT
jgi:uncharacterized membrane protein YeaQ/YmgE (transglycosylase-associated protein family)